MSCSNRRPGMDSQGEQVLFKSEILGKQVPNQEIGNQKKKTGFSDSLLIPRASRISYAGGLHLCYQKWDIVMNNNDFEQDYHSTLNNEAGFSPNKISLPQQVTASMNTGSGAQGNAGAGGETWTDLVDEVIYPRLKFKERYMETPEAPFQ